MGRLAWKGGIALLLLLMAVVLGGCGPQLADAGWGAVNADATTVYAGMTTGKFVALGADNGLVRWEFPKDNSRLAGFYGTPALAGNLVIFGASDPTGRITKVYALDAATGDQRWAFDQVKESVVGGPTVSGETVYVTSADHNVYALNLQTGQPVWPKPFVTGSWVWSSAVREGDRVYVGSMDHSVYAIRAEDGQQAWRFTTTAAVPGTPAVGGGRVYAGDLNNNLYAIDAQSGAGQVLFTAKGWIWGQPALVGNTLYASSLDKNVYALDAVTGQQLWAFPAQGAVRAGPVLVGNIMYVASEDQRLYAVDINTHSQLWAFNAQGPVLTPPVVVDGSIYLTTSNGKAFALDAQTGSQRWVYPSPSK